MNDQKELAQGISIKDLSFSDVQSLLDGQPDRSGRTEALATLYARRSETARVLQEQFGCSPDEFARLLSESFAPIFDALPSAYDLEFHLRDINVNTVPEVLFRAVIISKEAQKKFQADHAELNDYAKYIDTLVKDMEWENPEYTAGAVSFVLSNLSGVAVCLESWKTALMSSNGYNKPGVDISSVLPQPLRFGEGNTAGLSDRLRFAQESFVSELAKKANISGIVTTTAPTFQGERMLSRQGYSELKKVQLPESLQELATDARYVSQCDDGHYGKFVHVRPLE